MASKVWSEVYGLPNGTDTRVRVPMGSTDEGGGKIATHFIQTDRVPQSLDAEGVEALAEANPTLSIEFRSKQTDEYGDDAGTVRQRAIGEHAKARIAGLIRNVKVRTPAEGEGSEREPVNANGNGRMVNA